MFLTEEFDAETAKLLDMIDSPEEIPEDVEIDETAFEDWE